MIIIRLKNMKLKIEVLKTFLSVVINKFCSICFLILQV
jgi:hypothetical protein